MAMRHARTSGHRDSAALATALNSRFRGNDRRLKRSGRDQELFLNAEATVLKAKLESPQH
jgi:hypothetical protein